MNKKFLIIAVLIIAIVFVAFFAKKFSGEETTSPIGYLTGEKSIMEMTAEQGGKTMNEKEWIKGCEESGQEDRDYCYASGAIYYRDTSLCNNIKDSSMREECERSVEEYYEKLEDMAGGMENMLPEDMQELNEHYEEIQKGIISGSMLSYDEENTEDETITGGGGGGVTEDIYEITEQRQGEMEQAMGKVSDDVKVEIGALMFYYMNFISEEGMYTPKGLKAMEKVQEIQDKNNIDDDTVSQIPIDVQNDTILLERATKRYNELLEKGI